MSSDLDWLVELTRNLGGPEEQLYNQILQGELEVEYQPPWLMHPTYHELGQTPQAQQVLDLLELYVTGVSECASDVIVLLRRIADDLNTAPPLDTSNANAWRFALTIVLSTFSWFRGSYLGQPNARDYLLEEYDTEDGWEGDIPITQLLGAPTSPFPGLILDNMREDDAQFYRDLHVQLRIHYRTFEDARTLVLKLSSTDAIRDQITDLLFQIGQLAQRR